MRHFESWLRNEIRRRFAPDEVQITKDHQGITYYAMIRPNDVLRFAVSDTEVIYAKDVFALFISKLEALAEQVAA